MSTMLLAFNGAIATGQFLGDTLCALKTAYLMARSIPCANYLLALSPTGELNFLWRKFIDDFHAEVVHDDFHPGDMTQRFAAWNQWRRERVIDGRPFEHYRELYRRIDGADRQGVLCGSEKGLGRKNIFEYFYYGQEDAPEPVAYSTEFGGDLIYYKLAPPDWDVYLAPQAKCQGNAVFTFQFWDQVVRKLVAQGVKVTVNHSGDFCRDLTGAHYRRIFPPFQALPDEICRHRLVCCGNTGIGWMAAATGTPLLAMQPPDSHFQDYRYEWCGVKSLVEFIETPDAAYVVGRILEELAKKVVFTTGCYDILHAGHVRHLEESRALGTKLVVGLNSDASVTRLKGADRPCQKQEDRTAVLLGLSCVDAIRIFDGDDALWLIQELRPAVVTNGSDHKAEEIVGREFVKQYGGQAVVTSGDRNTTTTAVIRKIKAGAAQVVQARAMTQQDVAQVVQAATPLSPNPPHKLRLMAEEFLSVVHLPGEVADLGAYRGACSLILRRLAPDKALHVFDTWAGVPHDDPLCHHKPGDWPAHAAQCKRVVGENATTHFHQGVFPATAATLHDLRFCFVYVDMDVYQSTRDAIAFFWPRLVEGGKLMFDDWDWLPCAGVNKAISEAFKPVQQRRFPEAHACIVEKPGEMRKP